MELEFDKEMDALLRGETGGRTITIGEFAGGHPDADEIAAFLESALPAPARLSLVEHFADCNDCRGILSKAIVLNSDVPVANADIAAPAIATAIPWYRRLLLFPNLAYVMGGLVVLFSGFIGLSLLELGSGDRQFELSRSAANTSPASREPALATDTASTSDAANSASNTMSNTATTANTNTGEAVVPVEVLNERQPGTSGPGRSQNYEDSPNLRALPTQPPSDTAQKEVVAKAEDDQRDEARTETDRLPQTAQERRAENERAAELPAPAAQAPVNTSGPFRTQQQQVQLPARGRTADAAKLEAPPAKRASRSPESKQVGDKTFELRERVWYDTAYRGQRTTNVRRNTAEYSKLDVGLRQIAESFEGTVVTVWRGKAYRID